MGLLSNGMESMGSCMVVSAGCSTGTVEVSTPDTVSTGFFLPVHAEMISRRTMKNLIK